MSILDNPYVRRLLEAGASSLLDPNPVYFTSAHRRGLAPLLRILNGGPMMGTRLPTPLLRNQFLWGCKMALVGEQTEHLVVGFGQKRAQGTDITHVAHFIGDAGSVRLSVPLQAAMTAFLALPSRPEIILVHNHPKWWANDILHNRPVASPEDRDLMVNQRYLNPTSLYRIFTKSGGIRLFLLENRQIREIRAPNVGRVLEWLSGKS